MKLIKLFNRIQLIYLPAIFIHIRLNLLFRRYDNLKNMAVTPSIFSKTSFYHFSYKIAISRKLVNIFNHLVERRPICFTSKIQYRDSQLKNIEKDFTRIYILMLIQHKLHKIIPYLHWKFFQAPLRIFFAL